MSRTLATQLEESSLLVDLAILTKKDELGQPESLRAPEGKLNHSKGFLLAEGLDIHRLQAEDMMAEHGKHGIFGRGFGKTAPRAPWYTFLVHTLM